jgi:hypothetical protein
MTDTTLQAFADALTDALSASDPTERQAAMKRAQALAAVLTPAEISLARQAAACDIQASGLRLARTLSD